MFGACFSTASEGFPKGLLDSVHIDDLGPRDPTESELMVL